MAKETINKDIINIVNKYKEENNDNYTEYICIDQYGNYYIFKDTMTEGLTVSKDTLNLVVKIGGTVVDTSEYTLTVDKTNRIFTVEFKNFYTNHAKDANESLTFTYSAVVNEKAINDTNTSTNRAEVSYGNDPDHLTTGAPSEVKVLTHTLKINKVDEQNKPLSGAEFALYRNNVDSGKLKFVNEGNGTYRIATIDDETTTDTLVSPEGGVITVKGLSEGHYVIEETKAPDGYAKLKNTINKTISVDENAPQTVTVEEKVTNKTESWLPETGGMGTVIFTVVGVVGVLVILSTYFKKGKKREEA